MAVKLLLLWFSTLTLCQESFTYEYNSDACKSIDSDCVIKCCPEKQISLCTYNDNGDELRTCVDSYKLAKHGVKNLDNYSDVGVYDKDINRKIIKTNKSVKNFRHVANFTQSAVCLFADTEGNFLLENGAWAIWRPNYWNLWVKIKPGDFCLDHEVLEDDNATTPSVVVCITSPPESQPTNQRALTSAYGLLVSCVFLVLVLAVYALLPELRNLAGLILMACVSTYFAFFLVRIIHVFGNQAVVLSENACAALTVIFHYLTIATFCWMNVMSFDIWWKFRTTRKSTPSNRGTMSKFRRYCAYAWGLPLVPTLFVIIVDQLDLTHIPSFVQPHLYSMCYFDPETHLLYVNTPITILICINVILFLMSAYNIWKIKQGVHKYKDSATNQKDEYRFWVYLRLSLLMGVSWILEVIGNLMNTESVVWAILDFYNALIGFFIFLLFVCKKKIFLRLCDRYSINNKFVEYVRARTGDAPTKSACHTDTSDLEIWTPSYKEIELKLEQI